MSLTAGTARTQADLSLEGPHRNRTGLQIRRVFPTKCFHFQYVDGRWYREWYRECCYSECNEMVRNNSRHPRNPE